MLSPEVVLTKLPWLRKIVSFVQILHRKQHWSGQWSEMMVSGIWPIKTAFCLKHRATHGCLEICDCLFNILVSLWFLLGRQISGIPQRCCEEIFCGKGVIISASQQGQGMSENRDKKNWNVWPFLNFDCKFALYLECLCNSFLHWISSLALPAAVSQPLLPTTGSSL